MNVHPPQHRRLKAGHVKQALATDGVDDRGAKASHPIMNEDGVVLPQGLAFGTEDASRGCDKLLLEVL